MKIAYVVSAFPKLSETFILNQITGMIRKNHHVTIFADMKEDQDKLQADIEKYDLMSKTVYFGLPLNKIRRIVGGLKLWVKLAAKRPRHALQSVNFFMYGAEAHSLRLLYELSTEELDPATNFDIVHCQYGKNGLQVLALRNLGFLNGKLVVSFRGTDISRHIKYNPRKYNRLFAEANLMLPVCNYFKDRLVSLGCEPSKIVVHHSGIDCKKFDYVPRNYRPGENVRLVSVGRLVEKKGFEYSIKALGRLLQDNPELNIHYSIIGTGPLEKKLQELTSSLNLEAYITFLSSMSHPEVIDCLNSSHLFVAPCVTAASGDEEGIPNVIKEAMATGMPVVSTYHAGIPELVKDRETGLLAEPGDERQLANNIEWLINNPYEWEDMGSRGREYVLQKFDSDKLNDELEKIYGSLLEIP